MLDTGTKPPRIAERMRHEMKPQPRWLTSVIAAAAQPMPALPWERPARPPVCATQTRPASLAAN